GFLLTGDDQDFIVLNLTEPEPWRAVAHDFGLMLLNYNYPTAQRWFDEGLTQYFSSLRIQNRQGEIGGAPLQTAKSGSSSFVELLNTQTWQPLPELFAAKTSDAGQPAANPLYSAESWIVMHYLLHEK